MFAAVTRRCNSSCTAAPGSHKLVKDRSKLLSNISVHPFLNLSPMSLGPETSGGCLECNISISSYHGISRQLPQMQQPWYISAKTSISKQPSAVAVLYLSNNNRLQQ